MLANLNHSDFLSLMVEKGFGGKIYCRPSSFETCKLLLRDSIQLNEEHVRYLNLYHLSKHAKALPLYDSDDVTQTLKLFVQIQDRQKLNLATKISAKWIPNGHILGSWSITCDVQGNRAEPIKAH